MTDPTTAQMAGGLLDEFVRQYCAELQQLNYGRATISIYRRSITRLRDLMIEHGVALDALTPDIAAELVLRADWHGDRQPYLVFIVRRFVAYLAMLGVAMPPTPLPAALQRILTMPGKRYVKRPVTFLDRQEIVALLDASDRSTWVGRGITRFCCWRFRPDCGPPN
jgi:integrase